jgi:hypothetical protein
LAVASSTCAFFSASALLSDASSAASSSFSPRYSSLSAGISVPATASRGGTDTDEDDDDDDDNNDDDDDDDDDDDEDEDDNADTDGDDVDVDEDGGAARSDTADVASVGGVPSPTELSGAGSGAASSEPNAGTIAISSWTGSGCGWYRTSVELRSRKAICAVQKEVR